MKKPQKKSFQKRNLVVKQFFSIRSGHEIHISKIHKKKFIEREFRINLSEFD